jgi:hypothetical protein
LTTTWSFRHFIERFAFAHLSYPYMTDFSAFSSVASCTKVTSGTSQKSFDK